MVVHGVADENTRHMQDLVNRSKTKRRLPLVKGPTRRPMQHSAQWKPPQSQYSHQQHQQQQYRGGPGGGGGGGGGGRFQPLQRPFGRGGGVPRAGMGRGIMRVGGGMSGGGPGGGLNAGRGRGNNYNNTNKFNNEAPRSPLRKPRDNYRGPHGGGQRQGGGSGGGSGQGYTKHNKNTKPQNKSNTKSSGGGKARTNYKRDLENYYLQKNLGEVQYKVAVVGKGKEKYMATVTVEGTQFKTYPETYNSKVKTIKLK